MKFAIHFTLPALCAALLAFAACQPSARSSEGAETADTTDVRTPDSVGFLVRLGDTAPDFVIRPVYGADEGDSVRLSDLRGRVVMLQFTASWCSVCRREMPFIEREIWLRHKDNPEFALYAIDFNEPTSHILPFAAQTGVTYPIALDPGAMIFSLYADTATGVTRNVLIDRDGEIVHLTRLYDPDEFDALVGHINSLLGK